MVVSEVFFNDPEGERRAQAGVAFGEPDVVLSLAGAADDDGAGIQFSLPIPAFAQLCRRFLLGIGELAEDGGGLVDENGEGTDYALVDGQSSVWVRVDGVALWIRRVTWADVLVEAYRAPVDADEAEIASMEVTL